MSWKASFQNQKFKIWFFCVIILLLIFLISVPWYFQTIIEPKPGVQLNDFVLNLLPPADHSTIIFTLIYTTIGISLIQLAQKPNQLLMTLSAYCLMNYIRVLTLWLFTLEPPVGIIPLTDPILEKLFYGNTIILKDLFFSGHVATLTILALMEQNKVWKIAKWAVTVVVGLLLMHQRVHYAIDVVAGVIVSIGMVKLVSKFMSHFTTNLKQSHRLGQFYKDGL